MARIIGVDFDDVVVLTNHAIALWHNRVHGTSYEVKDILCWELATLWGCSKEEAYKRIRGFFNSDEHSVIMPVSSAVESLRMLHDENEVHIITARPTDFLAIHLWLAEQHIPFLLDRFNFINTVTDTGIVRRKKSEVCLELGVEIFIEDHLDYAYDVASAGIPVLLFDSPWNQRSDLPHNMERVFSWDEIVERLK